MKTLDTKVVVERPLHLNYQVSEERLENLYAVNNFSKLAVSKKKDALEKEKEKEKEKDASKVQQEMILNSLRKIDPKLFRNWDKFESQVQKALDDDIKPVFLKQIILTLSEHDDTADYVTDNRGNKKPDPKLRDTEKIPLKKDVDEYFTEEVLKYYNNAWMDRKKDKTGYEINFTQNFYKYQPPRPLEEIEADIKKVTAEIQELIKEDLDEA